jgi:hypothetical protein
MGLGNWMIKKTAKSTASSMSRYVKDPGFGGEMSGLKAWASTRRNKNDLLMFIDYSEENPVMGVEFSVWILAHSLFEMEMGIQPGQLKDDVSDEIMEIFRNALS